MPSLGPEGFGLVTSEAMADGLPCLISDLAVHREITNDGSAAMLFRSGDVEDLKGKLRELYRQRLRSVQLIQTAGYQRVHSRVYNVDVALKSYLWAFGLA